MSSAKETVGNKYLKLGKLDWFKEQKAVPVAESERGPSRGGGWRSKQGPWNQQHFNFMLRETGGVIWGMGRFRERKDMFLCFKIFNSSCCEKHRMRWGAKVEPRNPS